MHKALLLASQQQWLYKSSWDTFVNREIWRDSMPVHNHAPIQSTIQTCMAGCFSMTQTLVGDDLHRPLLLSCHNKFILSRTHQPPRIKTTFPPTRGTVMADTLRRWIFPSSGTYSKHTTRKLSRYAILASTGQQNQSTKCGMWLCGGMWHYSKATYILHESEHQV